MTAKLDAEKLMNTMLPLAETMLKEYGEFYPYGGYMKWNGETVDIGVQDPDSEFPKSKDLLYLLKSSLREVVSTRQCKATAMVLNVVVGLPNSQLKSDAVKVCLEHADGYTAEVFFPYELSNNEVKYGESFAQKGSRVVF